MKNLNFNDEKQDYYFLRNYFVKIRKATKKDLDAIIQLSNQLVLDHKQRFGHKLAKDFHTPKVKYFKSLTSKQNAVFFVAEEDNKIVGFIFGKETANPPVYAETRFGSVGDFYVLPSYRNKKIGRKLFAELKKWFRKMKYGKVEIAFNAKNIKARRLYRKFGFRPYKELWRMKIQNDF